MNATLNHGQPFLMRQGHLNDPLHHTLDPCDRISGGADRDRTGGLLVANQALSQLSYSPVRSFQFQRFQQNTGNQKLET